MAAQIGASSNGVQAIGLDEAAHASRIDTRQLRWRALWLGAANAFDYAMQFLLPVVLVRYLDAGAFGEYRLLWLIVGTALPLATMGMPGSLYYFLPRSNGATKRLYINQTLLFLSATGLAAGWAVSPWDPLRPPGMNLVQMPAAIAPSFVALWVVASLLDPLPTIDERVLWKVTSTVGLSALRAIAMSVAAIVTGDLAPVAAVLLAFAAVKLALLLRYVAKYHNVPQPVARSPVFADQFRYAAPIGVAGLLYGLRTQADQWIAAALFPLSMFASFSVAAVLLPLMNLFRQSVNYAFLPSMSRDQACGDIRSMLGLNSHANVTVAVVVCPLFAFAFVFASELVTIVYTETYIAAAPVMRVYIIGLAALVLELSSITMLLRLAPFVSIVNVCALVIAAPLNWFFAKHIGLAGAAVGSVAVIYLDRAITLWRISRYTGTPVRRLQDWPALALPLLLSVVAAAWAWLIVQRYCSNAEPLVRALAGGVVLCGVYSALYAVSRRYLLGR